MLRIIPTEETLSSIQHILRFASKFVLIICPFYSSIQSSAKNNFLFSEDFTDSIKDALGRGVNIVLFCKTTQEFTRLKSIFGKNKNLFIRFCDEESPGGVRLHSKIYMNENECLITSFNLASFSLENLELGVLFDKETNQVAFHDVLLYVNIICKACGITQDNKLFEC